MCRTSNYEMAPGMATSWHQMGSPSISIGGSTLQADIFAPDVQPNRNRFGNCMTLIIEYGTGNLNSIRRILDRIGDRSFVSSVPEDVGAADKIIMPGVGHFEKASAHLRGLGLIDALNEAVLTEQEPVLGICLG